VKILLSWLNDYGDFGEPTDVAAVQRVGDALTSPGLEVDSIDVVGETVSGVVTARVIRLEQHPDAAKVQRVYVDAGDGLERHVWCGAFNMAPGDIVPLATLGWVARTAVSIVACPLIITTAMLLF
jgi:phenylalanyl-tRNA synthetase beta chain